MDSILPTMDAEEAFNMLEGALAELRDTQHQLAVVQEQLDEMNALVFEQSATDALTGLKNRSAFDRIMKQQAARTGRSKQALSLVMVDVDGCKAFNTEFGRVGGDEVLQQVAQVLKSYARAYDYVVRYQSDEFAVVLPDTPLESAKIVAERARKAVLAIQWRHRPLTVSVGVASTVSNEQSTTLAQRAVRALDAAKSAGGNQTVLDSSAPPT
jgi:diguanylate cyclase (GGDEF)-like protein